MTFNSLILFWFDKNKRNLPWRSQFDPYKIWISEIILQQTRVTQGTAYYERFCERFPNLKSLAEASEEDVLRIWQGLGYYSRARNLHFTARYIQNELKGQFPSTYQQLLQLKGIGSYTAAAIASIAFHEAVPAIDGNVFRVFARYFNVELDIAIPKTKNYFFDLGKEIIDVKRPGDFNQAVMELGATICLPTQPKCDICPLNESCEALALNKVSSLPVKSKKVKVKDRFLHFLEISDGENFLLKKRTENDVWKNLYNFPLIELKNEQLINQKWEEFQFLEEPTLIWKEKHILSHQNLYIEFWRISVDPTKLKELAFKFDSEIFGLEEFERLPLPKPMEKYVQKILLPTSF